MIETVMDKNVPFPWQFRKIKKLSQAQHITIAWPFANVC
jgi:hypothetical protein